MAIDPRISLATQPTDVRGAIAGGLANREQARTAGIREQILGQQATAGGQAIKQNKREQALQTADFTVKLFEGLKGLPLDQRAAVVAQQLPQLEAMGIPAQEILTQDLSDQGIDQGLSTLKPLVATTRKGGGFQFGATTRTQDKEGNLFSATEVRDPATGKISINQVPIQGSLVSNIGETPEEREAREIGTAGGKQQVTGDIQTQQEVDRQEALREGKLTTAQALGEIELALKRNEKLNSNQVARLDNAIETGLSAVNSLPSINRGLELLQTVNTGGVDAKAKIITDFFGVTSGDIGELNNILAQNVLTGLDAFTGAISDKEREFIEKMNTGLTQGREFNIAELNRMRNIFQREVNKGLDAANLAKDEFAIGIFEDAIKADPSGFAGDVAEQAQSNIDFVNNL